MKISTKTRYGMRFMIDLAQHHGEGCVALKDVAERQGISKKYLEQVVAPLTGAGLLRVTRGYQGGYELARAPETITLADVVSASAARLHERRLLLRATGRLSLTAHLGRPRAGHPRLPGRHHPRRGRRRRAAVASARVRMRPTSAGGADAARRRGEARGCAGMRVRPPTGAAGARCRAADAGGAGMRVRPAAAPQAPSARARGCGCDPWARGGAGAAHGRTRGRAEARRTAGRCPGSAGRTTQRCGTGQHNRRTA